MVSSVSGLVIATRHAFANWLTSLSIGMVPEIKMVPSSVSPRSVSFSIQYFGGRSSARVPF